jgi:hypothetical protein
MPKRHAIIKGIKLFRPYYSLEELKLFFGKLNNDVVIMGTKKIETVKTEIPISAAWLPKKALIELSG